MSLNVGRIGRVLSGFVLFFSLSQAIPLVVALTLDGPAPDGVHAVAGFGASIVLGLVAAILLWLAGHARGDEFFRKESLAVVGLAWWLAGCLGAMPFLWSGCYATGFDALFESISGLTTTGATVCGVAGNLAIEELPPSVLLWRAMLQWMGGLGIILVFIVFLPAMGVTGKNLLVSEQVGVAQEGFTPRLQEQARLLFRIYVALTAAEAGLLLLAGMGGFDAVCHALTTMATGGFSTRNASIGAFGSVWIELIVIVFMFLAGTNFTLIAATLRSGFARPVPLLRSPEFRVYAGLTLGLIAASTLILWAWQRRLHDPLIDITRDYGDLGRCLRDASFQVVSILTSTGYSSADFQLWPQPMLVLLVLMMLVGSCTGSTAGGIKVLRLLVSLKLVAYAMRRFLRPKSVEKLKVGSDVVPDGLVSAILALVLLWFASIVVGVLLMSFDPRLDLLSAISVNASMMGCTGPALTGVELLPQAGSELVAAVPPARVNVGPYGSYGELHGWTKLLLCVQMILGRLELLAPLALVMPSFWRR